MQTISQIQQLGQQTIRKQQPQQIAAIRQHQRWQGSRPRDQKQQSVEFKSCASEVCAKCQPETSGDPIDRLLQLPISSDGSLVHTYNQQPITTGKVAIKKQEEYVRLNHAATNGERRTSTDAHVGRTHAPVDLAAIMVPCQ